MTLLLLLAWAGAEPAAPPEEVESEEIVVYGEHRIQEARAKVVADLKHLGYRKVVDKGDRLVLKHETSWKGKVVLHDDGYLDLKRQGVKGTMPDTFFKDASPLVGWVPCVVVPTACVKVGGVVVGKRKLEHIENRTLRAVTPSVQDLQDRMADHATDQTVDGLPERLEACWEEGVPLFAVEAPLDTMEARRDHLLAFWASRTDTVWGERVREVVEGFLRGVVQGSEVALDAEGVRAFNEGSHAGRELEL